MSAPALAAAAALTAIMTSAATSSFERTEEREPCAAHDPMRQPFFGDLHVHTTYSFDAWAQGTRNDPRAAYRFARGEPLGIQPYGPDGEPTRTVRLRRPLDFAMVSDHSEWLGETELCRTPDSPAYGTFTCLLMRRWPALGYMIVNSQWNAGTGRRGALCGPGGRLCDDAARGPWAAIQAAAEEAYDRSAACGFTTFVGFEWTGTRAGMIHRNVVFRNAVVPAQPTSAIADGDDPARLWAWLERDCLAAGTGCDALAIPHNSNWSMGAMFATEGLTAETAARRRDLEPLLEITQHKGDSECRSDPADPLCAYETPDFGDLAAIGSDLLRTPVPPGVYAREALLEGLVQWERLGVNPFRLGFVGSTDTHLGTPGLVDEDAFVGHAAGTVTARLEVPPLPDHPAFNPGGLAVLWAEENSRDALFAAMRRREAYGTSGPRIVVRFFGGWQLDKRTCREGDLVAEGYAGGVPMGGDLPPPPRPGVGPSFIVRALRDPGTTDAPGARLERVQIVKGWVQHGALRERVVTLDGHPVSDALDLDSCTVDADVGADEICVAWRDPYFDPAAPAFYYARVLEVPTCRWSWRACRAAGIDCERPWGPRGALAACCDPDVPRTIRERAWTSPVWYTPGVREAGS